MGDSLECGCLLCRAGRAAKAARRPVDPDSLDINPAAHIQPRSA